MKQLRIHIVLARLSAAMLGLLVFGWWSTAMAQDLKADLTAISQMNQKAQQFHAVAHVKVYPNAQTSTPLMQNKYEIKKQGNAFYYQMDGQRMLLNDHCQLTINDDDKTVVYTKSTEPVDWSAQDMLPDVDSLMRQYDSVVFVGQQKALKTYLIYNSKSPIAKTELTINPTKKSIVAITYSYNNKFYAVNNYVKVTYSTWSYAPNFSAATFSENNFITEQKNAIQLTGDLSAYELIINDFEN